MRERAKIQKMLWLWSDFTSWLELIFPIVLKIKKYGRAVCSLLASEVLEGLKPKGFTTK